MAKTATAKKPAATAIPPELLFGFGDTVKDETGLKGIVYGVHEYESGTISYSVLPPYNHGHANFGKSVVIDWQDLTLVKPAKSPAPRAPRPLLGFGDEVKDRRTDFTGTIISIHAFKNGCWKYGVQPRALTKNGARVNAEMLDQNGVEVVKIADKSEPPKVGGPERMPV